MMNATPRSVGAAVLAILTMSCSTGGEVMHPTVTLETTMGSITIELYADTAPVTTENFLAYVDAGHYDGLVFHRVIPGFMIQGGGHLPDLSERPSEREPIVNESDNGLRNLRGTISMARTGDPHSARSQFFINVANNASLDHGTAMPGGTNAWGYAVFGKVIAGMDVADAIVATPTGSVGYYNDVPIEPIVITSATRGEDVPSSLVAD